MSHLLAFGSRKSCQQIYFLKFPIFSGDGKTDVLACSVLQVKFPVEGKNYLPEKGFTVCQRAWPIS